MSISIHSISTCLHSTTPINELTISSSHLQARQFVELDGFKSYVSLDQPIENLVGQAIGATLSLSGTDPSTIDAAVICCESVLNGEIEESAESGKAFLRDRLLNVGLLANGLVNAHPYFGGFLACANMMAVLQTAMGLIHTGAARRVICCLADRVSSSSARLPLNAAYIFSDMSLAFIVDEQQRGFTIEALVSHYSSNMMEARAAHDSLRQGTTLKTALADINEKINNISRYNIKDHPLIITDNASSMMLSLIRNKLALDSKQFVTPTKSDLGHAFSMDCLLSLKKLAEERTIHPGDRVGLLTVGPWSVGFVSTVAQ